MTVPTNIIADCECSAGLKPYLDWYICPDCGISGIMET